MKTARYLATPRSVCVAAIWTLVFSSSLVLAEEGSRRRGRAESIRKLAAELGVDSGSCVADVGCGSGGDSLTWADIVGQKGAVYAEEIVAGKLEEVLRNSGQPKYRQVIPVLGEGDDPRLPDGQLDLIYMHRVFHHFSEPRAMLTNFWRDLKPRGFLVIVDQQKGPLRDPVPLERRSSQHHWTGETVVVRLAREAGFEFHAVLDELWNERGPFVLVFRKPEGAEVSDRDPGSAPSMKSWLPEGAGLPALDGRQLAFVGLDQGRQLQPLLRESLGASGRIFDLVLEEWAVDGDELPEGASAEGVEVVRVAKGQAHLPEDVKLDAVVFADAYHRLWEPKELLGSLLPHVREGAPIVVLDRPGPGGEARRVAGHRQRIAKKLVVKEMKEAGLELVRETADSPPNRFCLVFARPKQEPEGGEEPPSPRRRVF